jgi:hypothetical protein
VTSRALVGLVAAALGVLVFAFAAWVAIRPGSDIDRTDLYIYEDYGRSILDGAMPYRDFRMEYPPAAVPMFVLPATRVVAFGSTEGATWGRRTPRQAAITAVSRLSCSCSPR